MNKSNRDERKEGKERHATWLELFYDLVFVAVVSRSWSWFLLKNASKLTRNLSGLLVSSLIFYD
jgi:low temperature requirement protein LtrA